jgi:hypothetical protein
MITGYEELETEETTDNKKLNSDRKAEKVKSEVSNE